MKVTKVSEQYSITDLLENGWEVNGSASNNVEGSISINVSLMADGEQIGNINYYKPAMGNINMNYEVAEKNRDAVTAYADTLVDSILEQFKA